MRKIAAIAVRDGSENVFSIVGRFELDLGDARKVFADGIGPRNRPCRFYESKPADKNSDPHLVGRLCGEIACNKFPFHRRSRLRCRRRWDIARAQLNLSALCRSLSHKCATFHLRSRLSKSTSLHICRRATERTNRSRSSPMDRACSGRVLLSRISGHRPRPASPAFAVALVVETCVQTKYPAAKQCRNGSATFSRTNRSIVSRSRHGPATCRGTRASADSAHPTRL